MEQDINQFEQFKQFIESASVEKTEIKANDIIEMINSSLDKGEPFATEFKEKVIKPLADKINKKIEVTPIKVDGKSIGSHINKIFQEQTEKSAKSSVDQFKNKLSKLSITANLNLSSLLGQEPEKGLILSTKYKVLQWKLFGALSTNINKIISNSTNNRVLLNISSILGQTPDKDVLTSLRLKSLQWKLIKLLEVNVEKFGKSKILIKEGFTIGDILGEEPKMGLLNRMHYRRIQKILLKQLEETVKTKKDKPNLLDNIKEKASRILPKKGKPNLLDNIKEKASSILPKKDEKQSSLYKMLEKLINKKDDKEKGKYKNILEEQKIQPVLISEISEKSFKGLKKMFKELRDPKEKEKDDSKGLFSKIPKSLLSILAGAGIILGGLAALVGGILTDGPMKGALKVLGKVGLGVGLKLIGKAIGKNLIKFGLKRIPIIGSIISIAFAVSRFKKGDIIGGIIDLVSGLVGFLDLVVPGLGTVLSLGVDTLNAFLDVKAGGASKEASKKKSEIFKNMGRAVWDKLKKVVRFLPGIGTLIRLGESYEDIKRGNITKGLRSFLSAIAVNMPVVGTALAGALDMLDAKEEKAYNTKNSQHKSGFKKLDAKESDAGELEIKAKDKSFDIETKKDEKPFNGNIPKEVDENADLVEEMTNNQQDILKEQNKIIQNFQQERVSLNEQIKNLNNNLVLLIQNKDKNNASTSVSISPVIPESDIRDPAYILRTRVWDRLRTGYVLS